VDESTEIDPTQRVAKNEGRAPRAMFTSTFGDELSISTVGQAKVFGVSIKDRGAVSMAGHAGKAFWFSKAAGEFVTNVRRRTNGTLRPTHLTFAANIHNDPDIDKIALETAMAEELVAFEGVSYAVPSARLKAGAVPDNALMRAVLNNDHPTRSGDFYVVLEPGSFINEMDGLSVTVTYGSPSRYDTFVPILFAGYGITPQTVSRRVHPIDVALTLSVVKGTRPPSGATGEVLLEVLGQ